MEEGERGIEKEIALCCVFGWSFFFCGLKYIGYCDSAKEWVEASCQSKWTRL